MALRRWATETSQRCTGADAMIETFPQNGVPSDLPRSGTRHRGGTRTGDRLLLSRRVDWPLQVIPFRARVATPRTLTVLENILLHIHLTIPDTAPDVATITAELALEDPYFVEQTLQDLADLGAVEFDPSGHARVTDLGWECHRRGQVPSEAREQNLLILFDPIAGTFPDIQLDLEEGEAGTEVSHHPIDPDFQLADPNRIDLETIREVAARQDLVPERGNAVIFAAEPIETGAGSGDGPDPLSGQDAPHAAGLRWQGARLLVFVNDRGEARGEIRGPSPLAEWFQKVFDARLRDGCIDWRHLLGDSAIPGGAAAAATLEEVVLASRAEEASVVNSIHSHPETIGVKRTGKESGE